MPESIDWKSERICAVKESIEFFHNTNKLEREKWVVARLLENFIPEFTEGLLHEAEEPADVQFKDADFQVKEVLEHDRRRGDEYKKALEKAETAEEYGDLLKGYKPYKVSFEEIVNQCYEYSKKLTKKYGPKRNNGGQVYHLSALFVIFFTCLDRYALNSQMRCITSGEFRIPNSPIPNSGDSLLNYRQFRGQFT